MDPFWRPIAVFLFMTGARPIELGRLTWADVHLPTRRQERGRIILRHLKGRSTGVLQWRTRDVPVAANVLALLPDRGQSDGFVFQDDEGAPIAEAGGRQARLEVSANARAKIGEAFRSAADACGLGPLGVTPYWARQTFASLLVQDNVPLQVVAELLGHTSTREVQRTYGHLDPHQKERALASLRELE